MNCQYCQKSHDTDACPVFFAPITDCEHKDEDDGCCHHPNNMTPECHCDACPRIDRRLKRSYGAEADRATDQEAAIKTAVDTALNRPIWGELTPLDMARVGRFVRGAGKDYATQTAFVACGRWADERPMNEFYDMRREFIRCFSEALASHSPS